MAALWLVPSDQYLFLPDPARPVDPLVRVPDEDEEGEEGEEGGVYMVDVLVKEARLFERFFPEIYDGATLVPEEVVNPEGVSERERRRESLREMSASQQIAIAVALRYLGYDVPSRGAEVVSVEEGWPADGKLRPSDVIVAANGERVTSPEDLRASVGAHPPRDTVEVTIRRSGAERELEVGTRRGPDGRLLMGIVVQPEFEFPVDVQIEAGNIGGPSAGLAFALGVVDELGRDVDGDRRVAVTGELALDGEVSGVGGVQQKAIGARRANADAFVVPDENAAEARRYANGVRIVPVSTFREAVSALRR